MERLLHHAQDQQAIIAVLILDPAIVWRSALPSGIPPGGAVSIRTFWFPRPPCVVLLFPRSLAERSHGNQAQAASQATKAIPAALFPHMDTDQYHRRQPVGQAHRHPEPSWSASISYQPRRPSLHG